MTQLSTTDTVYLALKDAAMRASVSTRTLRRAIARRELRAHHLGRLVRIDRSELDRWITADGAAAAAKRSR